MKHISAKKPEKIWVVEARRKTKWCAEDAWFNYSMGHDELKEWRRCNLEQKFRLREYTAGKVLKD